MELITKLSGLLKAITYTIRVRLRANVKTVLLAQNCQGRKFEYEEKSIMRNMLSPGQSQMN